MPGTLTVTDGNKTLLSTRANENGFMPNRRGIPTGDYTIQPKAEDGEFYPKGTPAVTGSGLLSGQPDSSYPPDSVLIHKKGDARGVPDSRACISVDQKSLDKFMEMMKKWEKKNYFIPLKVQSLYFWEY
jgi:hypothetical protein